MTTPKPASASTALITGASSGIGEALAKCFAREGYRLILVARSAEKLKRLAKSLHREFHAEATAMPADLSQPGAAARLAGTLERKGVDLDVLVNNAGVIEAGAFIKISPERHQEVIALNIAGLAAMLAQFVPLMVERGRGRILNVASMGAFMPIPGLATYAATKAFALSLTETLSEELRGTGVTVTALCPGLTDTPMLSAVKAQSSGLNKMPGFLIGDVDAVAAEGYRACMDGEVIRVPGMVNVASIVAGRMTPKWLLRRIVGVLGRRSL